jgi:hypothetical protein
MFDFIFPVLADAHEKIQWVDGTYSMEDHKVVALLSISIYWSYLIRDILPKGSTGVLVGFESSCTRKFTYEVNWPDVVYRGAALSFLCTIYRNKSCTSGSAQHVLQLLRSLLLELKR